MLCQFAPRFWILFGTCTKNAFADVYLSMSFESNRSAICHVFLVKIQMAQVKALQLEEEVTRHINAARYR